MRARFASIQIAVRLPLPPMVPLSGITPAQARSAAPRPTGTARSRAACHSVPLIRFKASVLTDLGHLFYLPNGTPITAGNFLFGTGGGTTIQQPLLTGTDGADSVAPGFLPFFGTSSAAPHCAGVAALVESANPSLANYQVRNILFSSTIDIMASGHRPRHRLWHPHGPTRSQSSPGSISKHFTTTLNRSHSI